MELYRVYKFNHRILPKYKALTKEEFTSRHQKIGFRDSVEEKINFNSHMI